MYHPRRPSSPQRSQFPYSNSSGAWPTEPRPTAWPLRPDLSNLREKPIETVTEVDPRDSYSDYDKETKAESTTGLHFADRQYSQSSIPQPPSRKWPQDPVALAPPKKDSMLMALFDAILIAVPVMLIVKTGLVIYAWESSYYTSGALVDITGFLTLFLTQFNGQLVTAFTIVFVTVISTLVRRYALWEAQSGASISELEQLQGSISLPSTLKLIWSLRAFSSTSFALVVLWCFYYLGSQACQSEFRKVSTGTYPRFPAAMGTDSATSFFDSNSSVNQTKLDILNSYFIAATVLGDTESQAAWERSILSDGTDAFGSALVPNLDIIQQAKLEGYDPGNAFFDMYKSFRNIDWNYKFKKHRHGWYDVSAQSQLAAHNYYTSYVGRPLWLDLPSGLNYVNDSGPGIETSSLVQNKIVGHYETETSYLHIECGSSVNYTFEEFPIDSQSNQSISINITKPGIDSDRNTPNETLQQFHLWFRWEPSVELRVDTKGSSMQICNITQRNVDLKVRCTDGKCAPHRVRQRIFDPVTYQTPFSNDEFASAFFDGLLLSRGPQQQINQPTSGICNDLWDAGVRGDHGEDLGSGGYNAILTQAINTYYILSQSPKITGILPTSLDEFGYAVIQDLDYEDPNWVCRTLYSTKPNDYQCVKVHGATYEPRYKIFWYWIAMDFFSGFLLLAAAVAAHILRRKTLAPDIFGYVSSLTRDNPNIGIPDGGTTLSGTQRARLLKRVKVKIGDVNGHGSEIGRIGLARADDEQFRVRELRRSASYV